tara:strand:- start:2599 stop:2877 length:279 start_codon:yes stop_codon:yes gene_type:complete
MATKRRKKKSAGKQAKISLSRNYIIAIVVAILLVAALVYVFWPGDGVSFGSDAIEVEPIDNEEEAGAAVAEFSAGLSDIAKEIQSIDSGLGN